jgi:hypothetical protein
MLENHCKTIVYCTEVLYHLCSAMETGNPAV